MSNLENTTFDELEVGMTSQYSKRVTEQDITLFAILSGDTNPLHLDHEYAKTTPFGGCIAHGALCAVVVSAAVATTIPGPGSVYAGQEMRFKKPVRAGDLLTAHLEVVEKKRRGNIVLIENKITNQNDELVFVGVSTVVAPTEKVIAKPAQLPEVELIEAEPA